MKSFILPLFFLVFNFVNAQETSNKFIRKGDFPEGIYMTIEDVLNKKPSSTEEVYLKTTDRNDTVNLPEKAFFYFTRNG